LFLPTESETLFAHTPRFFASTQGRRPRQQSRGDNNTMYCTSMYAVHEYQTSKAA